MSYKLNRVDTPGLAGLDVRQSTHPIVVGDLANVFTPTTRALSIVAAAQIARGNFSYNDTAVSLAFPANNGIAICAAAPFADEFDEDVYEVSIQGIAQANSNIQMVPVAASSPFTGADATTDFFHTHWLPPTTQGRSGDGLNCGYQGTFSLTKRAPGDVAWFGMMVYSVGAANNVLESLSVSIGLRQWRPNSVNYPRYPDEKIAG